MSSKVFVLKHVFKNVTKAKEGRNYYSDLEEHYNVRWCMCIKRGVSSLGFYLYTDLKPGAGQSVLAEFKLRIIAAQGEVLSKKSNKDLFGPQECNWGWLNLAEWENVVDNYLIDGSLKLETTVNVLEMTGIPRKMLRSFGEDAKQFSDVALVVDTTKFYVSKLFLSSQSDFFATLFLGPFQESGKPEVQLKDINPEDLQCFLEAIYGEPAALDEDTVDGVLSIADMYNTSTVVKKCEEFLIEKSEKELMKKLQLAGKYKLNELKKFCMDQIRTVADIRSVTPEDPIEMDPVIVASLLRKVLTLV